LNMYSAPHPISFMASILVSSNNDLKSHRSVCSCVDW